MSSESAILEFPVKLSASISGEVDELIAKLQEAKELISEISETAPASTTGGKEDDDEEKESIAKLTKMLEGVDDEGIKNLEAILKNTDTFIGNKLLGILGKAGPYGAIAVALITLILATPELVKTIVNIMGMKGGPMNMDFRFSDEQEFGQLFSRELQFRRAFAVDPVITINDKGFVTIDPTFEGNSLIQGNLARSARIGINLSSYGYIHGI